MKSTFSLLPACQQSNRSGLNVVFTPYSYTEALPHPTPHPSVMVFGDGAFGR